MSSERCCKNCGKCAVRHAGRNMVYYECMLDGCIVEPTDRACDKFSEVNNYQLPLRNKTNE